MLKFIGAAVVVGALALGAAVYFDVVHVEGDAKLTPKGEQQVQELRNDLADQVRGDTSSAPSP